MSSKLLAAASVALVLLASSAARADEPSNSETPAPAPASKPAPKTESRWYGYQTLSTDAASIAVLAISAASDSKPVQNGAGALGLATYAIAPAIIHGLHGHVGKAVGDVAIRVLTPVLGAGIGGLVGIATWKPSHDPSLGGVVENVVGPEVAVLEGAVIGGLIGVGAAIAIDAGLLAHEDVPVEKKEADHRVASAKPSGPTFHPSAGPTKGGFAAGITGTF